MVFSTPPSAELIFARRIFRDMDLQHIAVSYFRKHQIERRDPATNVVMASVVNNLHAPLFAMLLHSIQQHNPWFTIPVRVLYGGEHGQLDRRVQDILRAIYPDLSFIEVDESRYHHIFKNTPVHIRPSLFKLDCLGMEGPEDIVYIDADILCLGDISELFSVRVPFGASPPGRDREAKMRAAGSFSRNMGLNAGVLMMGERYRRKKIYERFMRLDGVGLMADQQMLNDYFRLVPLYCLHHRYNYHAEFFWDQWGAGDDVRLLHYAGKKPLEAPEEPRMKPWLEAAAIALNNRSILQQLIRLPMTPSMSTSLV